MTEPTWREKWTQLAAMGCVSSRESLKLLDEVERLRPLADPMAALRETYRICGSPVARAVIWGPLAAAARICVPPQSGQEDRRESN